MECMELKAWIEHLNNLREAAEMLDTEMVEVPGWLPYPVLPLQPVQQVTITYRGFEQQSYSQVLLRQGEVVPDGVNKSGRVISPCVGCWKCRVTEKPTVIANILLSTQQRAWVRLGCSHSNGAAWLPVSGRASELAGV